MLIDNKTLGTIEVYKGKYFNWYNLQAMLGASPEETIFTGRLANLRKLIETTSLRRGDPMLCKQKNWGLYILLDSESTAYKAWRNRTLCRQIDKTAKQVSRINRNNLTPSQKRKHTQECRLQNAIVDSIMSAFNFNS